MKKLRITVEGMHCSSCASNIERSIKKVNGVKGASASLLTKKCIVEADDNVDQNELKKAVARIGYKASSIEED